MAQAPYYNLDVITPHIGSSPYLLYGSPHPALLGYASPGVGADAGGGFLPPIRGASPQSLLPVNVQRPQGQRSGSPAPSGGSNGMPFNGYGASPDMNNGGWVVPQAPQGFQQQPQQRGGGGGGGGGAQANNGWALVGQYQNNWGAPNNNNNQRGARQSVADMPAAGIRQGPDPPRRYDLISGGGPGQIGYGSPGRVSPADLPAAGGRRGAQREAYNIVTNQAGYGNNNNAAGGRAAPANANAGGGGGGAYGNFYQEGPAAGAHARANRRYSNYLLNGYEEPVQGVRNIASSAVKYDIITGAPIQ